ncbi:MAG TPA: NUDIX hydrolase [Blastocatellia bacterium]|nr:NUDIX hydrolase [Blastocatellia bacterium]
MYIDPEIISEVARKYGAPEEVALSYEMTRTEFDMVRGSQKHGRAHDVTLFIIDQGRVVVIKKPMYPEGAYRAPSGGVEPGEPFEEGALREAYEETGLVVTLERFLFRVNVAFTCAGDFIDWTSYVFSARAVGGRLQPIDTHEIVEARFASVEELRGPVKSALLASGSTGLKYRSDLSDLVLGKLVEDGALMPA